MARPRWPIWSRVLRGEARWPAYPATDRSATPPPPQPDLSDVRGQAVGRRAVEVAAAGRHHLLMIGPPGSGKTMLAERLVGVLPPLTPAEALAVTRIHSAAGCAIARRRVARATHRSGRRITRLPSSPSSAGASWSLRPGEVSMATPSMTECP